jgi:signal recognition particle subunit SRP54
VEKAQEQFDVEEARKYRKNCEKSVWAMTFSTRSSRLKKWVMKDLAGMIPGVGKALKNMDIDDNALKVLRPLSIR